MLALCCCPDLLSPDGVQQSQSNARPTRSLETQSAELSEMEVRRSINESKLKLRYKWTAYKEPCETNFLVYFFIAPSLPIRIDQAVMPAPRGRLPHLLRGVLCIIPFGENLNQTGIPIWKTPPLPQQLTRSRQAEASQTKRRPGRYQVGQI